MMPISGVVGSGLLMFMVCFVFFLSFFLFSYFFVSLFLCCCFWVCFFFVIDVVYHTYFSRKEMFYLTTL